ncbi:MAG TPA: cob(I)yrinic acid a,c-diamide adenosyltransferase [Alphaproteobacteria bacterium]|jgi:cob(I)alamin adenosyltransferase|nr:cob(I)yrinic acid a,c-diamide adenosyltransferase [Alphaproteobacteria bacterium]
MAIYTKTGDKGNTKVFDKKTGTLVPIRKNSCKIKSIGAIDELNSFLGIIGGLTEIQGDLFTINSILAGSKLKFSKTKTKKLEKQIDKWEGTLPVQKNFIFYGGSPRAAMTFYARALARRAERSLVAFAKKEPVPESVSIYMNRLSDYLFMLARSINLESGVEEKFWKTSKD